MIGFQHSKSAVIPPKPWKLSGRRSPRLRAAAVYLRSLPAEKARSPAPVMIATQASSSSRKTFQASISSAVAGGWREFITSGRLIVIVTIRSSCS